MKKMTVYVNDQVVYEYNMETTLDEQQSEFLDKMDRDMDRGIKIQGKLISKPNNKQRATFVAMNLIKALIQDNDVVISASCAYLANRLPALMEVHAKDQESGVKIEFIEETIN
jgi:hypothetical protein